VWDVAEIPGKTLFEKLSTCNSVPPTGHESLQSLLLESLMVAKKNKFPENSKNTAVAPVGSPLRHPIPRVFRTVVFKTGWQMTFTAESSSAGVLGKQATITIEHAHWSRTHKTN
jgi:hypothetical protein